MIDIPGEILKWSQSRPLWQRDALRRVIVQPEITAADGQQLAAMAKAESGITDTGAPGPSPLLADHLSRALVGAQTVTLESVRDVKNVNALTSGQQLTFAAVGLTTIYGENGTGKSGYARLLRRACRSPRAPEILPNIGNPTLGSPEATFTIKTAPTSASTTLHWQEGRVSPQELAAVSVFDRERERLLIDDEGELAYLPPGLDMLNALATVVEAVKESIAQEAKAQRPQDPLTDLVASVSGSPDAAAFVAKLLSTAQNDFAHLVGELDRLNAAAEDRELLSKKQRELADLKANDPRVKAQALRRLAASVAKVREAAQTIAQRVNADVLAKLFAARTARILAADAARQVAASMATETAAVMSPVGRVMLAAAERYAVEHVHPGRPFPDVRVDARCPLCLQGLGAKARDRFMCIRDLLTQEATREEAKANAVFEQQVEALKLARLDPVDEVVVAQVTTCSPGAGEILKVLPVLIDARRGSLLRYAETGELESTSAEIPTSHFQAIQTAEVALAAEAEKVDALAQPAAQEKLRDEIAVLAGRVAIADQKTRIATFIDQLRKESALQKCASAINTNSITAEGTSLAERALTGGFTAAFAEEMKALGASRMKGIKIDSRGQKGKTLYAITMPGSSARRWKRSQVLSEGEQRVVALAYFLAEARMAPGNIPLIIDDPVCSLDHRWSRRIAARLAELAKDRQVIVFTHSLGFFIEMENEVALTQAPLHRQFITRGTAGPGCCDGLGLTWEKLDVGTRIGHMSTEVKRLRVEHEANPDSQAYRQGAGDLCSRLRAGWERAVEEVVFRKVVERHGYKVMTMSLAGVVFEDADYKTITDAMTRLSAQTPAHDQALTSSDNFPNPDELGDHLAALERFVTSHKAKAKRVQEARKGMTEIVLAAVAKPAQA